MVHLSRRQFFGGGLGRCHRLLLSVFCCRCGIPPCVKWARSMIYHITEAFASDIRGGKRAGCRAVCFVHTVMGGVLMHIAKGGVLFSTAITSRVHVVGVHTSPLLCPQSAPTCRTAAAHRCQRKRGALVLLYLLPRGPSIQTSKTHKCIYQYTLQQQQHMKAMSPR